MTPAIEFLIEKKIPHEILQYSHDKKQTNFGLEAVEKLKLSAEHVFKTLLLVADKQHFIGIVPVGCKICLKSMAKAVKVKRIAMADKQSALKITGYIIGGISPLAQKNQLTTVIDISASQLEKIYISAGKRGVEIAIAPNDLMSSTHATFAEIKAIK